MYEILFILVVKTNLCKIVQICYTFDVDIFYAVFFIPVVIISTDIKD